MIIMEQKNIAFLPETMGTRIHIKNQKKTGRYATKRHTLAYRYTCIMHFFIYHILNKTRLEN